MLHVKDTWYLFIDKKKSNEYSDNLESKNILLSVSKPEVMLAYTRKWKK